MRYSSLDRLAALTVGPASKQRVCTLVPPTFPLEPGRKAGPLLFFLRLGSNRLPFRLPNRSFEPLLHGSFAVEPHPANLEAGRPGAIRIHSRDGDDRESQRSREFLAGIEVLEQDPLFRQYCSPLPLQHLLQLVG